MKKLIAGAAAGAALFASALPVFAGARNATLINWSWPGNTHKSAYFQTTGSGIVNAWTYDHPDMGDAKWQFKPLEKFENSTECDEGWVRENPNWTAQGIWNTADGSEDKTAIVEVFGSLSAEYLFCAYPME